MTAAAERVRHGAQAFSASANAVFKTEGMPCMLIWCVTSSSGTIKVYGTDMPDVAEADATWKTLRSSLNAGTATETQLDPDTASAVLAAGDFLMVDTQGLAQIRCARAAGSGTLRAVCLPMEFGLLFLLQKILDGGLTVSGSGLATEAKQDTQITSLSVMDDWDNAASDGASVSGDVAHNVADAGEPVKIGGVGLSAWPTAVTTTRRINAIFDLVGRQMVAGAPREMKGNQKTTITSSASETTIVTADATYKLDIYRLVIANTSATAATVTIKDSTAGTTRYILAVPAGETRGFSGPIDSALLQNAANNNWTATCTSVASIEITAEFVKSL